MDKARGQNSNNKVDLLGNRNHKATRAGCRRSPARGIPLLQNPLCQGQGPAPVWPTLSHASNKKTASAREDHDIPLGLRSTRHRPCRSGPSWQYPPLTIPSALRCIQLDPLAVLNGLFFRSTDRARNAGSHQPGPRDCVSKASIPSPCGSAETKHGPVPGGRPGGRICAGSRAVPGSKTRVRSLGSRLRGGVRPGVLGSNAELYAYGPSTVGVRLG